MLLREHRGALSADLRRYYGCNLVDVLAGRVATLREVADWVAHLPPEAATFRDARPDWQHDHSLEILRRVLLSVERAAVFTGKTAGFKIDEPTLYRFPWEADPDEGIRGDSMDVDEAADWLGWTDEMIQYLDG